MSDIRPLVDRVIEAVTEGNICRETLALCAKTTERQQDTIEGLKRKVALLEAFVKADDAEGDAWMDIEGDGSPDWDWHAVWETRVAEFRAAREALDWLPR